MWITVIFIAVKVLKNWSFSSLRYFNHTYNITKRITLFDLCFKSKLIELTHCIVFYFIRQTASFIHPKFLRIHFCFTNQVTACCIS